MHHCTQAPYLIAMSPAVKKLQALLSPKRFTYSHIPCLTARYCSSKRSRWPRFQMHRSLFLSHIQLDSLEDSHCTMEPTALARTYSIELPIAILPRYYFPPCCNYRKKETD